jgi:26S proteasome regulatory subunit N2
LKHLLTFCQPTLGVILLHDTRPSEPKSLLELKVKKATPAPAPGATGSSADQGPEGASATTAAAANDNLVDEGEEEASVPGEFDYESDTNPNDDD